MGVQRNKHISWHQFWTHHLKILAASIPARFFLDLQPNIDAFSTTGVTWNWDAGFLW